MWHNICIKEAPVHIPGQEALFHHSHSEELALFHKAAQNYHWIRIERQIAPAFKEAAEQSHRQVKQRSSCPHKKAPDHDGAENLALFDLTEFQCDGPKERSFNPKGAGRKPQPFIAYVKAIELAPILHIEQNMEAIALHLRVNPDFLSACGFHYPPSVRTLQDFDQIMSEAGLWERLRDEAYRINVDKGLINEGKEDTVCVDNTHVLAHSTPKKVVKECRECPHFDRCNDKVSTDETADWYVKSKCKIFYAHQIGMSALGTSGAPFERVVLSGRQYEPDSLDPLVQRGKDKHEDMHFTKFIADGIFNANSCRETIQSYYPGAQLYAPVNPKGKLKEFDHPASGIAKVSKHGSVVCIAGHKMVFLTKDENLQSYVFGCPVFNAEARLKLIHMGIDVSSISCQCKEQCCPKALQGRIYRVSRDKLKALNWDMPQFSYRFHMAYKVRTKIERLFGRMKKRLKMGIVYRRGIKKIEAHIDKFMTLMHIVANLEGSYGV